MTGEFVKGLKGVIGKGSPAFDVGAFSQLIVFDSAYSDYYFLTIVCLCISHSQTSSSPHPRYRRVISQAQRRHYSSRASNGYQISRMYLRHSPTLRLRISKRLVCILCTMACRRSRRLHCCATSLKPTSCHELKILQSPLFSSADMAAATNAVVYWGLSYSLLSVTNFSEGV